MTQTVWLTEDDIPGAKSTIPMDSHTMAELKWWLLCCSIKAPNSWNKEKLVSRYNTIFLSCLKVIISGEAPMYSLYIVLVSCWCETVQY